MNAMNATNVLVRTLAIASLALAITACSTAPAPQPQSWTGTTTSGDAVQPLEVDATLTTTTTGSAWSGTYTIGSTPPFTGDVVAELAGEALTGELIATSSCRFALTGNLTATTLEAAFAPTDCPGGAAGTWSATPTEAAE